MKGYNVTAAYYYGGNITVTNGVTITNAYNLGKIYDFMQNQTANNNLSEEMTTVNGIAYTFCINLAVGNRTVGGSIQDPGKTIDFNNGYDISSGAGGALVDLAGIGGSGTVGATDISKATIYPGETQTIFINFSNNL